MVSQLETAMLLNSSRWKPQESRVLFCANLILQNDFIPSCSGTDKAISKIMGHIRNPFYSVWACCHPLSAWCTKYRLAAPQVRVFCWVLPLQNLKEETKRSTATDKPPALSPKLLSLFMFLQSETLGDLLLTALGTQRTHKTFARRHDTAGCEGESLSRSEASSRTVDLG